MPYELPEIHRKCRQPHRRFFPRIPSRSHILALLPGGLSHLLCLRLTFLCRLSLSVDLPVTHCADFRLPTQMVTQMAKPGPWNEVRIGCRLRHLGSRAFSPLSLRQRLHFRPSPSPIDPYPRLGNLLKATQRETRSVGLRLPARMRTVTAKLLPLKQKCLTSLS